MTVRHFAEKGLIRRFAVVRPSQARVHKPRRYRPRLRLHVPYLQRTGRQWCLRPQCRKHVSNPCLWHCRDIAMRQGFFSSITVSSHRPTAVYLVHCWPKRHYAAQDCKLKTEPQRQSAQLKFCERPKRLTEPRASTGTAELEKIRLWGTGSDDRECSENRARRGHRWFPLEGKTVLLRLEKPKSLC